MFPDYLREYVRCQNRIFDDNLNSFIAELIFNLLNIEINKHNLAKLQNKKSNQQSLRINSFCMFLEDLRPKGEHLAI